MNMWALPRTGGLAALVAVIVLLPLFLPNNYYYDVAIHMGVNAIVVVGLNLLIGYAGQISLGHAGFFGLGAYSSGILTASYGWSPVLALLAGVLGVSALAYLVARPILRLRGHYLAMATLGLGIIIAIVLNTEEGLTGGPDGMVVPPFSLFGWELYGERTWYWVVGGLLVFSVWLALNIIDSPVGRAMRAVHGSEVAAQVVGVDTTHYKIMVFVMSAIFAGVMGSLTAHYAGFITPANASFLHSIEFVTMVVLGGMASVFGAVIGAVILTLLPQLLSGFEDYEMAVFGLILMLTMIFMPKGLVPTILARLRRRDS
ncbi:MAG: branched-chain amino acid ABC transporter permease [Gammaproteobacteria bacterium]|nr:MAG: branched-chain amino acid ABC transporter permease [Gammaproteobacteria bacterium]